MDGQEQWSAQGIDFTCSPKRELLVKELKHHHNDDPSRQYLKRQCPECEGDFFDAQKCESKLHSSNDNHKEDINDLRSRYHQVNKQYIFGEIDIEGTVSELFQKDQDADHDMNEKTKSNFDLPPNDLFHFFDQDEEHVDIQEI
ncbi:hypothetical protein RFI_34851 [Reticulomyxa filosa]|uniref:Uncharacterized protein n=1 Tax=Reticulomyxa filosa TaxID=46433 RepID=X6LN41_RETFI|nr:hypothetical protein RFI_34851 [Reticulomyxa filosa]|eukprot:ETO02567.1 hypothetical protein RFI_34851 [Reticulomyxa filosa]